MSKSVSSLAPFVVHENPEYDVYKATQNVSSQINKFLIGFESLFASASRLYTVYDSYYPEYVSLRVKFLKNERVRLGLPQISTFVDSLARFTAYYVYSDVQMFMALPQVILEDVKYLEVTAQEIIEMYSVPYESVLVKAKVTDIETNLRRWNREKGQGSKSSAIKSLEQENTMRTLKALDEFTGCIDANTKNCFIGISAAAFDVLVICQQLRFLFNSENTIDQDEKNCAFDIESHFNLMIKPVQNILYQCQRFQGIVPSIEEKLVRLIKSDTSHESILKIMMNEVLVEESEKAKEENGGLRALGEICVKYLQWILGDENKPFTSPRNYSSASPENSQNANLQHERSARF